MSNTAAETAAAAKYKGVWKRKWGKYVSEIRLPNSRERIWLGSYDTAEKAARAFDAALFCLRGRSANFNLPDDPPDIPGGQALAPSEIQAVAQRYGNSYRGGPRVTAGDGGFRAGDSDVGRAEPVDLVDGSFWKMVDMNCGQNEGCGSGFGLFEEPGEMYMDPHYEARVCEDEGSYYHGLWSF